MTDQKNSAPENAFKNLSKDLATARSAEEDEKLALRKKKELLLSVWTQLQPPLKQAIEQVSVVLAQNGFEEIIELDYMDYFGDDEIIGYGGLFCIREFDDSDFPIVVSHEQIFIGGRFNWYEGYTVSTKEVSVEALANAISETVKYLITEESV